MEESGKLAERIHGMEPGMENKAPQFYLYSLIIDSMFLDPRYISLVIILNLVPQFKEGDGPCVIVQSSIFGVHFHRNSQAKAIKESPPGDFVHGGTCGIFELELIYSLRY
jgi:hypothetical protein